jgi:hypothetical protein
MEIKKLTIDDMKQVIENENRDDIENENHFNALLPFIQENNDKPIDGWFKRRLIKRFPSYSLDYKARMHFIKFPKNKPGAVCSLIISYNGRVSLETYIKNNTWCQEKEHCRIKLNNSIDPELLEKYCLMLNQLNEAASFLDSIYSYKTPVHFSLLRLIPWEIKKRRD